MTTGNVSLGASTWHITEYWAWRPAHDPVLKGRGIRSWLYCPQCARRFAERGPRSYLRRVARLHVAAKA